MNEPFPQYLDSTMVGDFSSCPAKFKERYILKNQRKGVTSVHLHFGSCFAGGMETFRRAFYWEDMTKVGAMNVALKRMAADWGDFEPDPEETKTFDSLVDAFCTYLEVWKPENDTIKPVMTEDGPAVEFTFAVPIPGCMSPSDPSTPILYCGRLDMLGEMNGQIVAVDEKTTKSLSTAWAKQWELRGQFTGYVWGPKHYGFNVQGVLVRGLGILKKGIDTKEVYVSRPQYLIDRWQDDLIKTTKRIIKCYEEDDWPYDGMLNNSCSDYGGCPFLPLCMAHTRTPFLEAAYEKSTWNPLERTIIKEK